MDEYAQKIVDLANRTAAEAVAKERARLRPLLERCEEAVFQLGGEQAGRDVRFCPPERMPDGTAWIAELFADLGRELGKE